MIQTGVTHRLRAALVLTVVLGFLGVATVLLYSLTTDISRTFPLPVTTAADTAGLAKPVLFIGVVSRYPPPVIYHGYQPIMDLLTARTPYRFELRPSSSYQEAVDRLARGEVTAAFLGTYIYAKARTRHGLRAILKPLNESGEPLFRSVLFTRPGSGINGLKDLRGRTLALPSRDSYSGNWLLLEELPRAGLTEQDLAFTRHFSHHQSVVHQVLRGSFDAGVVKERVLREFSARELRVIQASPPIPGSPLVVHERCDPAVLRAISDALLAIDVRQEPDRSIVRQWDQEFRFGFVPATEQDFAGVRAIVRLREGDDR